jgi:hypothetical protein
MASTVPTIDPHLLAAPTHRYIVTPQLRSEHQAEVLRLRHVLQRFGETTTHASALWSDIMLSPRDGQDLGTLGRLVSPHPMQHGTDGCVRIRVAHPVVCRYALWQWLLVFVLLSAIASLWIWAP